LFGKQNSINKSGYNTHTEWTKTGNPNRHCSVNVNEKKLWAPMETMEGPTSPRKFRNGHYAKHFRVHDVYFLVRRKLTPGKF
jgi:hypothetical protein